MKPWIRSDFIQEKKFFSWKTKEKDATKKNFQIFSPSGKKTFRQKNSIFFEKKFSLKKSHYFFPRRKEVRKKFLDVFKSDKKFLRSISGQKMLVKKKKHHFWIIFLMDFEDLMKIVGIQRKNLFDFFSHLINL